MRNFSYEDIVRMIQLLVTLLLLYQGYALVPVNTVALGDPAIFTCSFPAEKLSNNELHWYKQSEGNTLRLIVKLRKHAEPAFGPEFSSSRVIATKKKDISTLKIIRTVQEDEGMYHCAIIDWTENTWHGTYLLLKGQTEKMQNYQIVQQAKVPDPAHESNSFTLQCSMISDLNQNSCPEDLSVFWFKAKLDKSHPGVIYADDNGHDKCKKKSDFQKRCVFSKNIKMSDTGTYYCAVASCGEIFFGNGTMQNPQAAQTTDPRNNALVITIPCLVILVIVNIVFTFCRTPRVACKQIKGTESDSSPPTHDNMAELEEIIGNNDQDLNYAALHFSGGKRIRGTKNKQLNSEEEIYSQVNV